MIYVMDLKHKYAQFGQNGLHNPQFDLIIIDLKHKSLTPKSKYKTMDEGK